jgi:nitroreductase
MNSENPAAFPVTETGFENKNLGMSLRDYFAAKALQGAMADRAFWEWIQNECCKSGRGSMHQIAAQTAYAFADAMLKERSK